MDPAIQQTITLLKRIKSVLFITGAGISAASGLPTYRGIGGLYENKAAEDGIPIEMALAGQMLATRPDITWKYLAQLEQNCRRATFNRAHTIIAQMETHFERCLVFTQNVDGFHSAAGSTNVIEIHGNVHDLKCQQCSWRSTVQDYSHLTIPPVCPQCGANVRPDVIFFGEMLDMAKMDRYLYELKKGFDLYVWVGTTGLFPYVQHPIFDARQAGRYALEINPAETDLSNEMDICIREGAVEALEEIWGGYTAIAS